MRQQRVETSIRQEGPATCLENTLLAPLLPCDAVRLVRNLRHGIVLVVGGDVVDQRFCVGAIPGPQFRCVERC